MKKLLMALMLCLMSIVTFGQTYAEPCTSASKLDDTTFVVNANNVNDTIICTFITTPDSLGSIAFRTTNFSTHSNIDTIIYKSINDTTILNIGNIDYPRYEIYTIGQEFDGVSYCSVNSDTSGINSYSITNNITMYPNPATNVLYISDMEGARVTIYDMQGRVMTDTMVGEDSEGIDVSKYPVATYVVLCYTKNGAMKTSKFVKR